MSAPDISRFKCVQCGRCCLQYGGYIFATEDDLKRWEQEGRKDILQYTMPYLRNGKRDGADLWFDPKTRRELIYCPFLEKKGSKYFCLIQKTKPRYCRDYICRKHVK